MYSGKARRLKQAKEEAQDEIEKYRKERERQFREFEAKHMGSREDVAAKIEVDTKRRIEDMNKAVHSQKEPVSNPTQYMIHVHCGHMIINVTL